MTNFAAARRRSLARAFGILALSASLTAGFAPAVNAADSQGAGGGMADPNAFGNPNFVVVVVRIATPPGIPRDRVLALMQQSVPQYQNLPGLVRKYFTISDDNRFGGVYLFANRAAAEHHFDATWTANVAKAYGVAPDVIYLATPIQIDGKNPNGSAP